MFPGFRPALMGGRGTDERSQATSPPPPATSTPEWPEEAPPYVELHEEDYSSAHNPLRPSTSRQQSVPSPSPTNTGNRPTYTLHGRQLAEPLVSVQAVKDHLTVLASFWQLKQDLLAHKQPELEDAGISDEDRWSIFLVKAHLRFIVWLNCRTCEPEHCRSGFSDKLSQNS